MKILNVKIPAIDCGDNEELFLALAALRDDKPDYQWFVWDEGEGEKFKQYISWRIMARLVVV